MINILLYQAREGSKVIHLHYRVWVKENNWQLFFLRYMSVVYVVSGSRFWLSCLGPRSMTYSQTVNWRFLHIITEVFYTFLTIAKRIENESFDVKSEHSPMPYRVLYACTLNCLFIWDIPYIRICVTKFWYPVTILPKCT